MSMIEVEEAYLRALDQRHSVGLETILPRTGLAWRYSIELRMAPVETRSRS